MELGRKGYTQEKFEQSKEVFGVYVLQSNSAKSAEEVFTGYKKRWGIKTFYQYLKNSADFNDLMIQDYYKEQGRRSICPRSKPQKNGPCRSETGERFTANWPSCTTADCRIETRNRRKYQG